MKKIKCLESSSIWTLPVNTYKADAALCSLTLLLYNKRICH